MGMLRSSLAALALMLLCAPNALGEAATWATVCEDEPCTEASPMRVVEYFGADWCEPCRPVETMLQGLEAEGVIVVHHRPSPADAGFSNASHQRFESHYGLMTIPSIVVDGEALLSGQSMAVRLPEVLAGTGWNVTDVSTHEAAPSWNATGRWWNSTAPGHVEVDSTLAGASTGNLTVRLFDANGTAALRAAIVDSVTEEPRPPMRPVELAGVTLMLGLLLAPALVLHARMWRSPRPSKSEEEG